MTGKKVTGAKTGKGKQLNQISLFDLFPKKQHATKMLPTAANTQMQSAGSDLEDLGSDNQRNFPAPVQELAAVAISVEPESPRASSNGQHTRPEIIDLADDQDAETPIEAVARDIRLSNEESEPGAREDNPIVILDSSPINSTIKIKSKASTSIAKKETYSIFAPRTQKPQKTSSTSTNNKSTPFYTDAPFPNRDLQHVRGPQTDFPYPSSRSFIRCTKRPLTSQKSETFAHASLQDIIPLSPDEHSSHDAKPEHDHPKFSPASSSSIHTTHLPKSIPPYQRSHPVISHLIDIASAAAGPPTGDPGNRLWTDKWRPRRADHVLYNENHATYFRDWLSALELQLESPSEDANHVMETNRKGIGKGTVKEVTRKGAKRQRVVRAVDRKASRKRRKVDSDEDDEWIVSDCFTEEDIRSDEGEETELEGDDSTEHGGRIRRRGSDTQTEISVQAKTPPRHSFNDRLTNTILLTGPYGCGKTAAVYACAEELGWEVFEVYPGIGRRNAANVDDLVGDVGKNHLVRKTNGMHRANEQEPPIKSHFSRNKRGDKFGIVDDIMDKEEEIVNNRNRSPSKDFGFMEQLPNSSQAGESTEASGKPQIRQSLILLEEVDILYHGDTNFWPAVISLIKECKRPVVLTCNDLSLVPTADLPLQDIRRFAPCPVPVAISFLQALCYAEGYMADKALLSTLCASTSDYHVGSGQDCLDLRRAIQHLQLYCPHSEGTRDFHIPIWERIPDDQDLGLIDWTTVMQGQRTRRHHTELLSFGDCHLIRSTNDSSAVASQALEGKEGTDDDVLGHRVVSATHTGCFGDNYDRDEMIMSTALSLSRGGENDESGARDLFLRGVRYEGLVREFRNNGVVSMSERHRRESFNMDYLPWIRTMMKADDEQENEMERMRETQQREGRRTTRNSQKAQHVRTILVSDTERKGMEDSELGVQSS
ncbi:hypothetical protein E1B28_004353 [Marasmius oreades]|uniref:AAA+ ATPase domain-containing protein n=1 Tax=Marasmius oreades TaxID=181124 RepID=A0A9P8ACM9_9AGAR|nr:uncharacterized protein E1B28_004353 [Marasmius oreades]KAG7096956.1 hypothetical protein E1B28_004353 [Marasmius oreades]